RFAKCTTFNDIPPLIKTRRCVVRNSASTASISFLPSMLVRSSDSSTGSRSCASSKVNVREDMGLFVYFTLCAESSCGPSQVVCKAKPFGLTNCWRTTDDLRCANALLNLQHPIQRHLGPMLHVVSHFDL